MIWSEPPSRSIHPVLTPDILHAWELRYGLRLPPRLIEELSLQNGGWLACRHFRIDGRLHEIEEIFGVAPDSSRARLAPITTWHAEEFARAGAAAAPVGDPRLLVPLCGDGHSYYCLDWNGTPPQEPSVCVLELENGIAKERVAASFADLLAHHYAGDRIPAFILGEREGVDWAMKLAVAGVRADGHTRLGKCFIGVQHDRLLIDHEEIWGGFGPTWRRLEFERGAIIALDEIRPDTANGRWTPSINSFSLRPRALVSLCSRLDARNWLWVNETRAHAFLAIADNDRERLTRALRLLKS